MMQTLSYRFMVCFFSIWSITSLCSEQVLGKVPIEVTKGNPNKINILTYNVQFLRTPDKDAPGITPRSKIIPNYVKDFDVVVFCEAFDKGARENLLKGMKNVGFSYSTCILGSGLAQKDKKNQKMGRAYDQPYINNLLSSSFSQGSSKYASEGKRKFAATQLASTGIDVAEELAKVVDKILNLFGIKSKLEKAVDKLEDQVDEIMHDGGVLIVSKYPIVRTKEFIFSLPTMGDIEEKYLEPKNLNPEKFFKSGEINWDWFANKGVVYAMVEKDGRPFHIFGTHTQAIYSKYSAATQAKLRSGLVSQLGQIAGFINSFGIPQKASVIIAGDLNIDEFSQKDLFKSMKSTLSAEVPTLVGQQYMSGNDIQKREPKPYRIDYVMSSAKHAKVVKSFNKYIFMRTPSPWNGYKSLSDHESIYGYFEFSSQ